MTCAMTCAMCCFAPGNGFPRYSTFMTNFTADLENLLDDRVGAAWAETGGSGRTEAGKEAPVEPETKSTHIIAFDVPWCGQRSSMNLHALVDVALKQRYRCAA